MVNKKLTAGVFILLAVIGTTYYIAQDDDAYFCENTNQVGLCWKLSKINEGGTQTRCYYNESLPTKYKNCKTGWTSFEDDFTGTIMDDTTGFDIVLSQNKIDVLRNKGIGKFEIRNQTCVIFNDTLEECLEIDNGFLGYSQPKINPCIKLDEFTCKARIYQKGGINKDINVIIKYCEVYVFNVTLNETTNECDIWKALTNLEIEDELLNKSQNLLNTIYLIESERKGRIEETLSREINLNIE